MEALGRLFNVVPVAVDTEINLKDASGVTFICSGANAEVFTVESASDAAGTGAAALAAIGNVYTNTASGAAAWAQTDPTTTSTVTTTTAAPVAVFSVHESQLPDGHTHVRVGASATGTVIAILHDLHVQRAPQNLPAVAV